MKWCSVDEGKPTLTCFVRNHLIIEETLYTDGSMEVRIVQPLTEMTYTGTIESRKQIHEWMLASALNPETPFGYTPESVLPDGNPGLLLHPGVVVCRTPEGKFYIK